jgi:hypothetical protein
MKQLIINADDFGLTEGINEGVIYSVRHGVVTSTSLMTNTEGFSQAVNMVRQYPNLGIGIHLNLVKGKPLSKASTIVNKDGYFYTLPQFLIRMVAKRIDFGEVKLELRSQIERIPSMQITHLDSHRHTHIFPPILELVIKLAKEYKIGRVRCPLMGSALSIKELAINYYAYIMRGVLFANMVKCNDDYAEMLMIEKEKNVIKSLDRFCQNMGDGVTEISCHPGFSSKGLNGIEARIHNRSKQVEILTNPQLPALFKKYSIGLINYGGC